MATIQDLIAAGATVVAGQIDREGVKLGHCLPDDQFELSPAGEKFVESLEAAPAPEAAPRARKGRAAKAAPEPTAEPMSEDTDLGDLLDNLSD